MKQIISLELFICFINMVVNRKFISGFISLLHVFEIIIVQIRLQAFALPMSFNGSSRH